jgi:hypothetical protein
MRPDITEADWRAFKAIKAAAPDRLCSATIARVTEIAADPQRSAHERFLAIHAHTRDADREITRMFDGHSRSRARLQLMQMVAAGQLTPEDLSRLSATVRKQIR